MGSMKYGFYVLTVAVVVLDHATKWLVRTQLGADRAIEIVPGYLRIAYVGNTGVAFGLFRDLESPWKPYVLAAMAVAAVAFILVYSVRTPGNRLLLQVALAVTMGGIIGNFIDRVARGFVVDFIEFHIEDTFHWPTFNVADSAISVGIAMLLLDTLKNPERGEGAQSR